MNIARTILPTMKKHWFMSSTGLFVLGVLLFSSSYLFTVNILLWDRVLPNIRLEGNDISLLKKEEIEDKYASKALSNLPQKITISYNDQSFVVSTEDLDPTLSVESIIDAGRGNNPIDTVSRSLNVLSGTDLEYQYNINIEAILKKLPVQFINEKSNIWEGNKVVNCSQEDLNLTIDLEKLKSAINTALRARNGDNLELGNMLMESEDKEAYEVCQRFNKDIKIIKEQLKSKLSIDEATVIDLVSLIKQPFGGLNWEINDTIKFDAILSKFKAEKDVVASEGRYEEVNGRIRLHEMYKEGKVLDIAVSKTNIKLWLADLNTDLSLSLATSKPNILAKNLPIDDFTKLLSSGQSRINLYVGEYDNLYVENSRVGVQEIDNVVIQAGEEFSFFNILGPTLSDTWRTDQGRFIGLGICNSSTTIFRAALEAGFPILERYNHGWSIYKYSWPYPENVVDATYLTDPKIDLRFSNDLAYPVLFKTEIWNDGVWEYQKVSVYTSSKSADRKVELKNFKTWDVISPLLYKGSFDRSVTDAGTIIREDTFTSHYHMLAPY